MKREREEKRKKIAQDKEVKVGSKEQKNREEAGALQYKEMNSVTRW